MDGVLEVGVDVELEVDGELEVVVDGELDVGVDGELEVGVDGELDVGGLGGGRSGSQPLCGDAVGGAEVEEAGGLAPNRSCDIR